MKTYKLYRGLDNKIIFQTRCKSLRDCLKLAISKGVSLFGLSLCDVDLSGINLEGLDLRSSRFYRVNLSGANLVGTDFSNATFQLVTLTDADLRCARMFAVEFMLCSAREVDFSAADLGGAWLFRTDLVGSDFIDANLFRSTFEEIDLFDPMDFMFAPDWLLRDKDHWFIWNQTTDLAVTQSSV